ncbi:hypothetical protein F5Y08DRAFT_331975 [Xylaria arbuscula]|nr:hypothetical protein F5Y08DRAFT_331975 [Xylaria arbuscula]
MASISVEPPSQVQRGMTLYPPLVVSCSNGEYNFFRVILVDSHGEVADQQYIHGTLSVSPQTLGPSSNSSRPPKDFAVFHDLVIGRSGTYTLQVNAYQMDYDSMSMYHAASILSREVRVRTSAVSEGRPSNHHPHLASSESRLLVRLSDAGFPIP